VEQWFEVDKAGLAKLLERKGKVFVLHELVQNAWDQKVTKVDVHLLREPGSHHVKIMVEDDDPDGFVDLSHAFTLFAESNKKTDATKRGRFNLGEKLVLAVCTEASIVSTTGGYRFDRTGRHRVTKGRSVGSLFTGRLKMTNAEMAECAHSMRQLIAPEGIVTTFYDGETQPFVLPVRTPIVSVEATLPTEIADQEGNLRKTVRKTTIRVFETGGDPGTLYEMGIPVVETGDRYHVDIGQKVPLNLDRDNVPPAYLRDVRTLVLNAVHARITDAESANAAWVRDALADENIDTAAVTTIITQRFGDKVVAYDPSDPEANKRVVAAGYVVVTGSQMGKDEWRNVRRAGVMPPAGRVMPTPKPYSDDPNAPVIKVINEADMSAAERAVIASYRHVAHNLLGFTPNVRLVVANNFEAAYGSRCLDINRKLGAKWFAESLTAGRLSMRAISLLIHELGHEFCGDHLSSKYYEALTDLGAKLAIAVQGNNNLLNCETS